MAGLTLEAGKIALFFSQMLFLPFDQVERKRLLYNSPMLTRIGLKNFKLHSDTKIEAAPLTVFIGPNNSGKSSVFQSLLLWRQSATRKVNTLSTALSRNIPSKSQPFLFPADQIIDIGEFEQVVRRGQREVSISVAGNIASLKGPEYAPGATDREFEIRVRENRLVYQRGVLDYEIKSLSSRGQVSWEWVWGQPIRHITPPLTLSDTNARIDLQLEENLGLLGFPTLTAPGPIPPEKSIALQEFMVNLQESARKLLGSIHPVFPLRGFEEAGYPLAEAPESLDRMALQDRTIALLSILAFNRDVERRLSAWLEELVKIKVETKLLPGKRVTIYTSSVEAAASSSLFSNEGTGASQLPFILVPIGLTPVGESLLLCEPEVHLHPRAQVQLTRLFVQLAKKEKRQFFIETHSEHVLHALLNSVATRILDVRDLAIYYFENKDGKAVATRLQVDDKGGVEGGLPGFFDHSLGELSEYLEALKSK